MKNKTILLVIGLALVLLLAVATIFYQDLSQQYAADPITPTQNPSASQEAQPGTDAQEEEPQLTLAPDFTVFDGEGNPVSLSDFRGKPVIVNFWASWCGPCKMEMPDFEAKCKELEGDVVFMMVNATDGGRETVDTAKQFVADSGYSFPVYYDTEYSAIYAYGVNAFPTTFFIDAEGNLVAYGQGAMSGETLQTGIDMIME